MGGVVPEVQRDVPGQDRAALGLAPVALAPVQDSVDDPALVALMGDLPLVALNLVPVVLGDVPVPAVLALIRNDLSSTRWNLMPIKMVSLISRNCWNLLGRCRNIAPVADRADLRKVAVAAPAVTSPRDPHVRRGPLRTSKLGRS